MRAVVETTCGRGFPIGDCCARFLPRSVCSDEQAPAVFGVIDKFDRQPQDVSREKFAAVGLAPAAIDELFALLGEIDARSDRAPFRRRAPTLPSCIAEFRRYFDCLEGLGVARLGDHRSRRSFADLAYYTGHRVRVVRCQGRASRDLRRRTV